MKYLDYILITLAAPIFILTGCASDSLDRLNEAKAVDVIKTSVERGFLQEVIYISDDPSLREQSHVPSIEDYSSGFLEGGALQKFFGTGDNNGDTSETNISNDALVNAGLLRIEELQDGTGIYNLTRLGQRETESYWDKGSNLWDRYDDIRTLSLAEVVDVEIEEVHYESRQHPEYGLSTTANVEFSYKCSMSELGEEVIMYSSYYPNNIVDRCDSKTTRYGNLQFFPKDSNSWEYDYPYHAFIEINM